MTKPRFDDHSTEFGLWLRHQKEIDSSKGYTAHNIDYLWCNYEKGLWMLLEEKRYKSDMDWSQEQNFKRIHRAINSKHYKGFHIIKFEETSPEDGKISLDKWKLIDINELINFLRFEQPEDWYQTKIFNGGQK